MYVCTQLRIISCSLNLTQATVLLPTDSILEEFNINCTEFSANSLSLTGIALVFHTTVRIITHHAIYNFNR